MTKRLSLSVFALAVLSAILFLACPERGAGDQVTGRAADGSASTAADGSSPVTPVEGPSWLHHLGLEVSQTHMGQMGGTAPQPGPRGEEPELVGSVEGGGRGMLGGLRHALSAFGRGEDENALVDERFELTGADIYRLSCRSCHGPDGTGSPPEIKSLLDPVRGSSAEAIQARMKARGTPIDDAMAAGLASTAEDEIRKRLQDGGEKMPDFKHLRGDEVDALLAYLRQLAGVGGDRSGELLVPQSAARVGEHLVKGTCHICHNATGPGGHHEVMMSGIIPSLESFPEDYSLDSVLYKVENGTSQMTGMMGGGGMMGGRGMMGGTGRHQQMPALPYLSREEIAAGYVYLGAYPPQP